MSNIRPFVFLEKNRSPDVSRKIARKGNGFQDHLVVAFFVMILEVLLRALLMTYLSLWNRTARGFVWVMVVSKENTGS